MDRVRDLCGGDPCLVDGCARVSAAMTNRVPSEAPEAPSASAAASPRPSAIPPAAMTGAEPATSQTAGTRTIVATSPRTCPPASQPWATMMSTPSSTDCRACPVEATVFATIAPASCAIRTSRCPGSAHWKEMIGTPASRSQPSRSSCGQARIKLAAKGRSVSARVRATAATTSSWSDQVKASMPRAPALLTAAASSGRARPPIGAWTIGMSIPARRQSGVSKETSIAGPRYAGAQEPKARRLAERVVIAAHRPLARPIWSCYSP
jgi:hypothetical protein